MITAILGRFVYTDFSLCWLSVSGDLGHSPHPGIGEAGNSHPAFGNKWEGQKGLVSEVSQWPSTQNNQYGKVACFEVVCPDPLHLRLIHIIACIKISFLRGLPWWLSA